MTDAGRWVHLTGSTYGTWVRGDRRGWRARHHREHCDGDYRNPPPPQKYRHLERQSYRSMPAAAVKLSRPQQSIAGEAFVRRLRHSDCLVLAVSVDAVHYHILMRCPPGDVRWVLGLAKKHASHELRSAGLAGRVWAKRCGVRTVRDRAHQLRVYRYILAHARRGAWTWNFKDHPDE